MLNDVELSEGFISDEGWNPLELQTLGFFYETADWGDAAVVSASFHLAAMWFSTNVKEFFSQNVKSWFSKNIDIDME